MSKELVLPASAKTTEEKTGKWTSLFDERVIVIDGAKKWDGMTIAQLRVFDALSETQHQGIETQRNIRRVVECLKGVGGTHEGEKLRFTLIKEAAYRLRAQAKASHMPFEIQIINDEWVEKEETPLEV